MGQSKENTKKTETICLHCGALNTNVLNNREGLGNPLMKCVSCGQEFLLAGVSEWEFLSPAMQVFTFLKPIFLAGITLIILVIINFISFPVLDLFEMLVDSLVGFLPRSIQMVAFIIGLLTIPLFILGIKLIPIYKLVRESLKRTRSDRTYRQQLESFVVTKKNQEKFAAFAKLPVYVARGNQQIGNFDDNKISEMLRGGQLLSTDLGIRQGHQHWQPLSILFPNNFPRYQATLVRGRLHPVMAFCIAMFILNLPTMLFVGGFIIDSLTKSPQEKKTIVSITPTPLPSPTIDGNKYGEVLKKKDDLFKLSLPAKLETNPIIKPKLLVIEKLFIGSSTAEYLSENLGEKYGLKKEEFARSLDELQTLIQIKCYQGKEIGQYGPRTAYYSAYAAVCEVTIIDYKASKIIGKKTFINAKPPKTIPENGYNFINDSPTGEVEKYLSGLRKE